MMLVMVMGFFFGCCRVHRMIRILISRNFRFESGRLERSLLKFEFSFRLDRRFGCICFSGMLNILLPNLVFC
ncbi:hypothetical protein BRADI_1g33235v3 [Brachypodium distachyon]|uniref:Uncharacterized protein n=1 Tax=Brachypodium distachyon TaxID=15368 RepID=A0A2K2DMI0_BRADI|nr:hypothetical protein BRADI_1g33235v3 [Brachypodium distachyon]